MAVKIRLTRMGRKKRPFYRIVVADARFPRDGRYIENIGTYNPITEPPQVSVAEDRAVYWLDNGALPTQTVRNLLKKEGILHKRFLLKRGFDEVRLEEEMKKWEVLQLERKRKAEAAKIEAAKAKSKAKKKDEKQDKESVPEVEPSATDTGTVAAEETQAEVASKEGISKGVISEEVTPEEGVSEEAVSEKAAPEEAASEEVTPEEETVSEESAPKNKEEASSE